MKVAERVVMVLLVVVFVGGAGWLYVSYIQQQKTLREVVATGILSHLFF